MDDDVLGIPVSADLLWAVASVVALVLPCVALRSLWRSNVARGSQRLVWTAVVVLVPVLGPAVWLAAVAPVDPDADGPLDTWHGQRTMR